MRKMYKKFILCLILILGVINIAPTVKAYTSTYSNVQVNSSNDSSINTSEVSNTNKTTATNNKKSIVICVAGQSNAVGYDESVVNESNSTNLNPDRLRQLGIYDGTNLQSIPLGHHAHGFQNMTAYTNPASPTLKGTKGVHLPLGNLLLSEIPKDYNILFVSATYGGTGFLSGAEGSYNEDTKLPSSNSRRWGLDTPFYKSMRDRIQYALDLNEENIFGGVIWIQGENDISNPTSHYNAFKSMTDGLFNYFNTTQNGKYKKCVLKGVWDKDIWYNVETVGYWYTRPGANEIWNNYRKWNPKTYVEIPRDTDSNAINGTGKTSSTRTSHFGNDAYKNVVAPKILEKILENKTIVTNDNNNDNSNNNNNNSNNDNNSNNNNKSISNFFNSSCIKYENKAVSDSTIGGAPNIINCNGFRVMQWDFGTGVEKISIAKQIPKHDSKYYVFLDKDGNVVKNVHNTGVKVNDFYHYTFDVPPNAVSIVFNSYIPNNPDNKIMCYKNHDKPTEYCDYDITKSFDQNIPMIGQIIYLACDKCKKYIVGNTEYIKCDGSTLLVSDYPELAKFMDKDSKTTFELPNIQNGQTFAYVCANNNLK